MRSIISFEFDTLFEFISFFLVNLHLNIIKLNKQYIYIKKENINFLSLPCIYLHCKLHYGETVLNQVLSTYQIIQNFITEVSQKYLMKSIISFFVLKFQSYILFDISWNLLLWNEFQNTKLVPLYFNHYVGNLNTQSIILVY